MPMNLGPHAFAVRQLQYAVAVAESLNFRKAAEGCHVSQPSLSAQLAQMEGALEGAFDGRENPIPLRSLPAFARGSN